MYFIITAHIWNGKLGSNVIKTCMPTEEHYVSQQLQVFPVISAAYNRAFSESDPSLLLLSVSVKASVFTKQCKHVCLHTITVVTLLYNTRLVFVQI